MVHLKYTAPKTVAHFPTPKLVQKLNDGFRCSVVIPVDRIRSQFFHCAKKMVEEFSMNRKLSVKIPMHRYPVQLFLDR